MMHRALAIFYTPSCLSVQKEGRYNAAWPQFTRPKTQKDPPMTERYHLISSVT